MLQIEVPGRTPLSLSHVVLDLNGTASPQRFQETQTGSPHPINKKERGGQTMWMWKKVSGAGKKICFWALMVAMGAAGFGALPAVDAVFLILGILLFGVACTILGPSTISQTEPNRIE